MAFDKTFSEEGLSLRLRKGRVTVDCQGQATRTLDLSTLVDLCNRVVIHAIENPTGENGNKPYVIRKGKKHVYAKVLQVKTKEGWEPVGYFTECDSRYVPHDIDKYKTWQREALDNLEDTPFSDYKITNKRFENEDDLESYMWFKSE